MGRSSERFGADQDIQSKFIKKSEFHIIIGRDVISYLALYLSKKWQGVGKGMVLVSWSFMGRSKAIES